MIIPDENIHRVFTGDMLSFIKKHENEILDVTFGSDLHVVVVELKGNDRHGFQLQSELYFRSPGLWGTPSAGGEFPIRHTLWTDMLFTRITCPDIPITFHPFSSTSGNVRQLPYFIEKTDEARHLYSVATEVMYYDIQVFYEVSDFIMTTNDLDITNRILDVMWNNDIRKYMKRCFTHIDTRYRHMYTTSIGEVYIDYHERKPPLPVIDAMYSIDDKLVPGNTAGNHLKSIIDRCIDDTKNMELRMFLIRWKMEHYGFDEKKEMRL